MSLKNIIENFLLHVENLDLKLSENEDLYEKEFQNLKILTDQVRATPQYICSAGELPENKKKNRYKDILPYDFNRVTLHDDLDVPGSDYINASYIKGASGSIAYIAAQAPLSNTVDDFWRMAWESEVLTIIMVCNEIEAGRPKCERYWPNKNEVKQFGKIMVNMVDMQEMGTDYRVRQLSVSFGDMTRTIHHFHYHTWPDHGTPLSVKAIIEMVGLVRKFQASETVPILVHCSAGCGRTGTVCAIDYVGGLLRNGKLTDDFNIKQMVFEMRKQRIAMVQTAEQYMVVHRAVQELFEDHLKVIDSHPYANIDFTGQPYLHKLNKKDDEVQYANFQIQKAVIVNSEGPVIITVSKEEAPDAISSQPPPLPKKTKFEQQNRAERENLSKHSIECLETNSDNVSNKSRMDYVKDWCDGILTTKNDSNEGSHSEQPVEVSQQQVFATKLSTPGQSPNHSPSLKRCSTIEIVNDKQGLGSKPNLSNLVRKPSMAKFRALFDNGSNSGSSGTSSPENWLSRSSSRAKSIVSKKSNDDDSSGMEKLGVKKLTRSKSKANDSEFLKDKICSNIINRYDDTAHRIFKENRNLNSDSFENFDYSVSGATPSPSSRSGNGDDFSLSDSPSPRIFRHRSYLSVSHSPLPTSNSDSVMKDLVTRVVGSRRNSFAEKRSSTWYDNTTTNELDCAEEKDVNPHHNYKKVQNIKSTTKKNKNNSTSVKRSISMKVGFRSPIFSRRKNINENVAPYLAIEESSKKFDQLSSDQIHPKDSSASLNNKGNLEKENSMAVSNTNTKCSSNDGANDKVEDDMLIKVKSKSVSKERSFCRTMPVPSPRLSRVQQKGAPVLSVVDKRNSAESIGSDKKFISHNESENIGNSRFYDDRRRVDVERMHHPVRGADNSPSSADDLYGAEMDEYCQKIILDCQKYLVARQTGGLPSQSEIDQMPNCNSPHQSVANYEEKSKNHDYERLWFSRSASKNENYAKTAFYADDPADKVYANHSFHQHTLEMKAREAKNSDSLTDENAVLRHDMENLRYNFNKVITDAVDRGQRKPLPAPRTILHSTKSTGSESPNKNVGRPHIDDTASQSSSFNNSLCDSPELTLYSVAAGRRSFHEYENALVRDGSCHLESERAPSFSKDIEVSEATLDERECLAKMVAENLTIDGGIHSASTPLYRSVHKCKSRAEETNSLQNNFENDEQFVILRTKNREGHSPRHMSKSLASVKPVAPPRMRRKPSISSSKSLHTSDCRPVSLELDRQYFYGICDDQHQCNSPDLYNEIDSPDEIPPVPVKTKDAYRLPQDESSINDLSSIESPAVSSGLPFSKAFNKFQTNIFLKFAHSNEEKDNDSSKSVIFPRKSSQRSVIVPGFSNRLDMKPKGPRDPPPHWKLSSCTL